MKLLYLPSEPETVLQVVANRRSRLRGLEKNYHPTDGRQQIFADIPAPSPTPSPAAPPKKVNPLELY